MPDPDELLQVVTETATLEKRDVLTGRVRVSTRTELTEDSVSAALRRNNVSVTRVRIDREVESAPSIRTHGDLTIIPVLEEILVVEKRLMLREEIHVRQNATTQSVELPVTLRRQRATVERDDNPVKADEEEI